MKQNDPQMRIRLPVDVKRWLELEAERNLRTQNSEIVRFIRDRMERVATTGSKFGDQSPVEAGNSSNQEES